MRNTLFSGIIILLSILFASCSSEPDVHNAARNGDLKRIKVYVQEGGKVDSLTDNEDSILSYAALGGQVEVMRYLIVKGADERRWNNGEALIHTATRSKNVNAVKILLNRGANVNSRIMSDSLRGEADAGQTPLLIAAKELDYPMAAYLISRGAHVNVKDEYGHTPLITANFYSNGSFPSNREQIFSLVKLLVENGADVNLADKTGSTPIALAALTGHKVVVEYLIQKGADINKRGENGNTAFSYAALDANKALCEYLITLGARPNDRLDDGSTVLMQSIDSNNVDFLRWLILTFKYNIQDRDTSGHTLLMYTVGSREMETTAFVVNELKMDVNASDSKGVTPLMLAAAGVDLDKIKFLVEKGSRVNVQDQKGLTPIMYIAQHAQVGDSGPGNDVACYNAIKYLMEHGGRTDTKNKAGLRAVDYVSDKPFPELITLLR
ncbi:ankyrin repeat domain-containing protein [Hymenobacter sp. BT635]|uniref:Ankyrin repeat domain-containing protein n=1 Tax=Hymenobacter nitidus TaxID=2880929 RepID=A0ABS8AEQ2_9BACT|nr:ankyrin repeat domain-containing protein [Hymenobacter nitidus]MCB2377914.1 ankyrin repeat domain-containing protein [Hymenobacter nitidus]